MKKVFLLFSIAAQCSTNVEAMNNSEATNDGSAAHQRPVAELPRPNLTAILVPLAAEDNTPAVLRKPHRVAQSVGNAQPRNLFQ